MTTEINTDVKTILSKTIADAKNSFEFEELRQYINNNLLPVLSNKIKEKQLLLQNESNFSLSLYYDMNEKQNKDVLLRIMYYPVNESYNHNTYSFDGYITINLTKRELLSGGSIWNAIPVAGKNNHMSTMLSAYEISQTIGGSRTRLKFVSHIKRFAKQLIKDNKDLIDEIVGAATELIKKDIIRSDYKLTNGLDNYEIKTVNNELRHTLNIQGRVVKLTTSMFKSTKTNQPTLHTKIFFFSDVEEDVIFKKGLKKMRSSNKRTTLVNDIVANKLIQSNLFKDIVGVLDNTNLNCYLSVRDYIVYKNIIC